MSPKDKNLLACIAALARAAPPEWREFMREFTAYSARVNADMVRAQPALVMLAQGRAQQVSELATEFGNAVNTADRIAARRTEATQRSAGPMKEF